jgi:hypothetical protein
VRETGEERREARTVTDIGWLEGKGKRYYISSADKSAEEFYRNIRGHGPENLNIMRKTALPLPRAAPNPGVKGKKQMSGPKKRFTAAMNPDYILTVIFGK